MSYTAVFLPILAALSFAQEKFLGLDSRWLPTNDQQGRLIHQYLPNTTDLQKLSPEELKSCASIGTDPVNKFLKENGFSIQLEKDDHAFAIASILKVLVTWQNEGKVSELNIKTEGVNNSYPAVKMDKGFKIYALKLPKKPCPAICFPELSNNSACIQFVTKYIIEIETKNGDKVYMTTADSKLQEKALDGFELLNHIANYKVDFGYLQDVTHQFTNLIFPMVDLDHQSDISWLIRMRNYNANRNQYHLIDQALQQTKFKMDEKGAIVESAVAISIIKTCIDIPKPDFTIDKPFYIWIERANVNIPLFAGYIDTANWKKPAR